METEVNSNSTDLRVPSFSCYLKPHDNKSNVFGVDKFSAMETGYQDVFPKEAPFDLQKNKPTVWINSGQAFRKWLFHGFRWVSPCSTKKAVYVNEMGTKPVQFAFPVLNPKMEVLTAKQKQFEEAPRKSIEVFSSGTMNKGDIMKKLERKISILTWDAIPKANDEEDTLNCDDVASEASSDLFEIENISETGSFASCIMSPSTQANVDQNIEFSSVCSDYDENAIVAKKGKKDQKIHPGFLGCKNHQSVKVAEPVSKTTYKSKH